MTLNLLVNYFLLLSNKGKFINLNKLYYSYIKILVVNIANIYIFILFKNNKNKKYCNLFIVYYPYIKLNYFLYNYKVTNFYISIV